MYYRITNPDELYHYGVLGMHWGVRRYQNYDGTRIATGGAPVTRASAKLKNAYRKSVSGGQGGKATGTARVAATANPGGKSGLFERSIKKGKGKENSSPAEEISKSVRDASRDAKPLVDIAEKHDPKTKAAREDLSKQAQKMSDKELRDQINRIRMEREYVDLKSSDINTGYDKAREILEIAGDVASIAVSIATLIAIVSKLKHEDLDPDTAAFIEDFTNVLAQDGITLDGVDLDYLEHHGIKGMKWGVRRYQNYDGTRIGGGGSKASSNFRNSIVGGQGGKATETARVAANAGGLFGSTTKNTNSEDVRESRKNTRKYFEMLDADMDGIKRSRSPQKKQQLESQRQSLQNEYNHLSYRKASKEVLDIAKKWNLDGDIFSKRNEKDFSREEKNTSRDAKKDAEEFARAKAFYGEGAGNRRKAIKTTVDAKSKKDDFYALEFEYHLSQQDMEEHMRMAKRERSQRDTATNTRRALNKTNRALGQLSRFL